METISLIEILALATLIIAVVKLPVEIAAWLVTIVNFFGRRKE